MAREIRVILTDDIDGTEAARTVEFSLDRASYSIDLSEANIAKLEAALATFIENAEKVGRKRGRKPVATGSQNSSAAIRIWARENGYEVSERGRVPSNVIAAYEAAN